MNACSRLLLLAMLAACGACADGDDRAGDDDGAARDARSPGAATEAAVVARGELLSLACQACHSLASGGPHGVGPNLFGVFGRAAGRAAGFDNYSDALAGSDIVWSPEVLDRWLEDPAGFLPGTTMAFTGYRSAGDRAALIAYLVAATGGPGPGREP